MQCTALCKGKLRKGLPRSECRCNRRAVTGYTVCEVHGAGAPYKGRPGGRPIVTGMYSKKASKEFRELYEEFLKEEKLDNLDDDIAMLRTLLSLKLARVNPSASEFDEDGNINPDSLEANIGHIRELSRDIRYTIQQKNDIMSQYMIPVENVQIFLRSVMVILASKIHDKGLLDEIIEELQGIRIMETDIYQQQRYGLNRKRPR